MGKSTYFGIAIILLIVGAGFFMLTGGSSQAATGNVVAISNGEFQELTIGMKNYNYDPNTVSIKAGQPVKLTLDDSVYGCFRDFVVQGTSVRKYSANAADTIEFTIDSPGTYTYACSMGMGYGKLIVE